MENNYTFKAKCIGGTDGDTADFTIDIGFKLTTTQRLRFINIDCPERGQPNYREAKEFVEEKILGKMCRVVTHKSDSFGRYLADVHYLDIEADEWKPLSQALLDAGLAVEYRGD